MAEHDEKARDGQPDEGRERANTKPSRYWRHQRADGG